jgi:outer membrane receptor protein involved in Fe transport
MSYRTPRVPDWRSPLAGCFLAVAILVALTVPAYGQLSSGSILGTITDATGAVIPGVSVKVTNSAIGLTREVISNESGNYRVDQLPIGSYNIEVQLAGFKTEVRANVKVDIDQRARLDFVLQPGSVTDVIEVSAEAPLVQSEDSSIGQVVEERKIIALPLNGRDFSQLAYMVPGAFTPRPGSSLGDRGGFSVAGLNENTNQFLLDGVNNNGTGTMEIAARINVDAVGEFKVQTGTYAAQYGRYAGAQVDVVTKSGTNQLHGSAFGFTRNDNLDARNFFDRTKPEFRRHQYGGTVGGAIVKDKLFYFAGFQGQRQYQFQSTAPSVPRPEMFNGDLSGLSAIAIDPQTGLPFPNNQIPANRISDITRAMARFWPVPERSGVVQNASALLPTPDNFYQPNGKIDWQISSKHRFSGSYNYYNDSLLEWAIAGRPEVPGFMTDSKIISQGLSLSEVWTLSPSIVNEFRAGFGRVRRLRAQEDRSTNWNLQLGLPGTTADVDPIAWGVPYVAITGFARIGDNTNMPQPRKDQTFSFADSVSIISGNHAFKVGGDFFAQTMNLVLISNGRGVFRFTGQRTGNAFADFLLGLPAQTERQPPLGPLSAHPRRNSFNAFFQDDWKVRPNLTFNIGVRYEATGRLTEKYGKLATFDPTLNGGRGGMRVVGNHDRFDSAVAFYKSLYPTLTIERGAEELFRNDYNNLAPRFGFAWSPMGKTVVRGAYGIFYQIDDLCLCDFYQNPPFNRSEIYSYTTTPGLSMTNPWGTTAAPINMSAIDPELASPYYQQASLGIQHEVPGGIVMDVSWQMKKGSKVDRARDLNQPLTSGASRPYANFGRITMIEDSATTVYHGLHTRFEKRTSRNESFLVSYVWGKMIDDASTTPQDSYNLRAERSLSTDDVRHRFNASYVLPLPFGPGQRFGTDMRGAAEQIVGGWELSGIFRASSGNPLTAQLTRVSGASANTWDRPNQVSDPNRDSPTPDAWWNKSAFTVPAAGAFGNAGRNTLIGPGNVTFDFNILKNFDVTEAQKLQFRFEFFNLFNQANFQTSGAQNPEASSFGAIVSALPARQIQLGLKYFF